MIFAFLAMLTNSSNCIIYKTLADKRERNELVIITLLIPSIVSILAVIGNWQLSISITTAILLTVSLVIRFTTTSVYATLAKELEIHRLEIYIRLFLIVTLIIDILTKSYKLQIYNIVGILLFIISVYLISNNGTRNSNNGGVKISLKLIFLFVVACLLWGIKPYIFKVGLALNCFNSETLLFIDFTVPVIYFTLKYKPKITLDKDSFWKYSILGISKYLSLYLSNIAIALVPVFIVASINSSALFVISILSLIFLNIRMNKYQWFGAFLASISVLLITIQ